jgi:hypothetical protein
MKKALIKNLGELYFFEDGVKKIVDRNDKSTYPKNIRGDLTGISGSLTCIVGDITSISGDLTHIRGDLTHVSGNLAGIVGDLTGISGDLTGISGIINGTQDDYLFFEEERSAGIDIQDLIF